MNNNFSVSIIVAVYNVEKYLEKCLDSLVNQTLKSIEIIVVNDGSTDGSLSIIKAYQKKYPNIKIVNKENGGLSSARNVGIEEATGDFIGFVDADDYVCENMFEALFNSAVENDADVAVCEYYRYDESNNDCINPTLKIDAPNNLISDYKFFDLSPYAWNKIFKRDLILESGILFPVGRIYEDIPTVFPWLFLANKISIVDIPLYYYRINRTGSIMSNRHSNGFEMLKSLDSVNNYFMKQNLSEEGKDKLCSLNVRHIFFRLYEFKNFKDKAYKLSFIKASFEMLNRISPSWKKCSYFKKYKPGLKNIIKVKLMTSEKLWNLYIKLIG